MNKNYRHILVPLDGSALAETVLADALNLAELNGAAVTLLQVVPPAEHVVGLDTAYPVYLDQLWESQKTSALEYLSNIRRRLGAVVPIDTKVELGTPAETIIDYAHEHPIDLIVMATHGRSGVQRWVFGSVADKVLRGADLPILLVRAQVKQAVAA